MTLGLYFTDGMTFLTNDDAEFATEPDGMFLSNEALDVGTGRLTAGETRRPSATELVGSPDLVDRDR